MYCSFKSQIFHSYFRVSNVPHTGPFSFLQIQPSDSSPSPLSNSDLSENKLTSLPGSAFSGLTSLKNM